MFAIAVISFLFVKLGLVRGKTAGVNVLFATIVFMSGGILGTFHHLYFAGTTTAVVALGASISALEVVPLAGPSAIYWCGCACPVTRCSASAPC